MVLCSGPLCTDPGLHVVAPNAVGTIEVENNEEGGARFAFEIPVNDER